MHTLRRLAALLALAAMALGAGGALAQPAPPDPAAGADAAEQPIIPAGQETLLADMLGKGATLPDGCALTDGRVEFSVVHALYACPGGEVAIDLLHPSRAPAGALTTERFAIAVRRGAPPASLTAALAARIRAREADFEWRSFGAARAWPRWAVPLAALAGAALLAWALRRRARRAVAAGAPR